MEPSVESPSSSSHPNQGPTSFMGSPPLSSPDSDQRFWSSLLGRVDSLLEQRNAKSSNLNTNKSDRAKRLKEDSLLLMRGFDSVGYTLSQLSNNLDNALQLAVAMATKTSSLARELKSLKSNICFMQERCAILDEENRRLRNGVSTGVKPEEDDLVRLQMEALLAEKSRLANENANLTRENQCLYQLAEYHQLTSQDLSLSYDEAIGMCLDFSSPPPAIVEGAEGQGQGQGRAEGQGQGQRQGQGQCDY
ncbi:uncharacterized protein LOC111463807 isoform X4 [Cucurbita moschata]|uniref:Uncharacterized protein LOC111463807 isoform X4 n=1 Tax=Cucurbita moschata TaxID=3662 RepID=A0A6J1HFE4_CUCMO|nr:uncharacterized protein LOC111463807 isoform X4 [Cucurbita moschata]